MRLAERLGDSSILLTGVTGFVGEALLHRLLRDVPGVSVSVLVRPKGSQNGSARVAQLLDKPIFADIVAANGGVEQLLEGRIRVLDGDLAAIPELPGDVDTVVHCAGDVSFDPPISDAFETNVSGTARLLERVTALGSGVHYVHISTAYVAGRRRGAVPERSVTHDADWRAEAHWGHALRDHLEAESRSPRLLSKLRAAAEREHRRAGLLTAASDTERRRREWVERQLVAAGTERARSLGWTDAYTFTKALGERVVEEYAAALTCSIVRPSIIESALRTPYPGWIEGFKMAEPLILAYGRGELPEFPASPDGVVDIVPVDAVVAAVVAVLGERPVVGQPAYFHVCTGARNPLTFRGLYDIVRGYFERHPFDTGDRGAVRLPAWRFSGGESVERLLATSERAHRLADLLVTSAPRGDRIRDLARRLDERQRELTFLRRYVDLYTEYARAELSFLDDATMALFGRLDAADRDLFDFDTGDMSWEHYLGEVHCPAVTAPLRRLDDVRRRRDSTPAVLGEPSLPSGAAIVAAFDMDGTLLSSNVIETYLWMRFADLDSYQRLSEAASVLARLPGYVRAERRDRGAFLRAVYRRYAGADLAALERLVDDVLAEHILSRVSPSAVRRVRAHRAAGHRTVLITGAIRPLTRPLTALFDAVVAADLAVGDDGRCTGYLTAPPLVGESRAAWLRHTAETEGADLAASYAYADSHSDLPMLQMVGHPVAVNPDVTLQRAAKRGTWEIVDWRGGRTSSRLQVPSP